MARDAVYFGDGNIPYKRWTLNTASALEGSSYDTTVETAFTALGVNDADPNAGGTPRYLNQKAGVRLHYRALVHVVDQNSTDTLTLKVRFGSASGTVVFTGAAVDVADNDLILLEGDIWITTVGSSGKFNAIGSGFYGGGTDGRSTSSVFDGSIDTTGALDLVVTADWSVNHNDNDATLLQFEAELWPAFGTADES